MTPAERDLMRLILTDLQAASDAADTANGTAEYSLRLVAVALIARHFLRECGAVLSAAIATPEVDNRGEPDPVPDLEHVAALKRAIEADPEELKRFHEDEIVRDEAHLDELIRRHRG